MTKIMYVQGGTIVGVGVYQETDTEYLYEGFIVPKTVVPDPLFIELDLPKDFNLNTYKIENDQFVALPPVPDE